MNNEIANITASLADWFKKTGICTIATSGGIDSMLLAFIANQALGRQALIAHSTSSSVPTSDAARVRHYAEKYDWQLALVQAGELSNDSYRNNPVNRCYYCKSCLFNRLTKLDHGTLITGTNLDDLDDYRPGLIAAKEQGVRQPYVELAINKAMIRKIADYLGLDDIKNIPSSPCLSSRIETGIPIEPEHLLVIDKVENYVRTAFNTDIVRFRIRHEQVELELEPSLLNTLQLTQKNSMLDQIKTMISSLSVPQQIQLAAYKQGSAFINVKNVG